ncbi:MAG TPA: cytochrome c peroxidase [Chitinophagales bacterium]|nr:cytochrome c peroxidase [Chitinophagales bacterium]
MKRRQVLVILCMVLALSGILSFAVNFTHPYPFKYNEKLGQPNLPFNNPLTIEGVQLGRLLFYDPLLSGNNKQSCGSCHIQQFSFTDGNVQAVGALGDTVEKNTMSLVNMAWNHQFFWDGRARTLEDVIHQPITDKREMGQDTAELIRELNAHPHYPAIFARAFPTQPISMATVSKAVAQFVRTITSRGVTVPDSLMPELYNGLPDTAKLTAVLHTDETLRGSFFRFAQMCGHCHSGVNYGGVAMADNMIDSGKAFKAPSLINVSLTAPYMHDGRFKTIEQVLNHYNGHIAQFNTVNPKLVQKPIENLIKESDKQNFAKVLQLFTDTSVLTNKELSNPFAQQGFSWSDYQ